MSNVLSFIIRAKDEVSATLTRIKSAFGGMGGSLAGAFSVTAIAAFGKSVLNYVGQIKDASEATGISTDKFQALAMVAKTNGVSMEQLTGAIARLRNVQGSVGNDKNLQSAFASLKISIKDVQSSNPEQLLASIAKGLGETGNASAAFDLFGRGAAGLLSTLKDLEAGWDPLVQKMRSGIISESDIERIDQMGDTLDTTGTKLKAWSAVAIGAWANLNAWIGKMSAGESMLDAAVNVRNDNAAAMRERREKREAAEVLRQAEEVARKKKADLDEADKESGELSKQWVKANLSDEEYKKRLQGEVNALVDAANEQGLDELELRKRQNEALKATIELRQIERAEAEKTLEAETKAQKDRLKNESDYSDKSKMDKLTPEQQLESVNNKINEAVKARDAAKTEVDKKAASDTLIGLLEKRDGIRDKIKSKAEERAESNESLIQRDRDLRESAMTPAQRRAASQKRVEELKGKLAKETDPDKQLKLRGKLMDEAEKQAGIGKDGKPASFERSIGMGDIFTRRFGQQHKKDPAEDAANSLKSIEKILKNIEDFGPGGFGK